MGKRGEDGKRVTKKSRAQSSYDTYGKYNGKYIRKAEERIEQQMVLPNDSVEGIEIEKKKNGKKCSKKK